MYNCTILYIVFLIINHINWRYGKGGHLLLIILTGDMVREVTH